MLMVGTLPLSAITTQEMPLGELVSGNIYSVPANTIVTGQFTAPSDGVITLTSSVDANTNLVPYSDSGCTNIITTVRDEVARTKTFDATSGTTYYFKQTTSPTTSFDVTFTFTSAGSGDDPEPVKGTPTLYEPAAYSEVSTLSYIRMTFSKEDYPYGLNASGVAKLYNSSDEYVTEGTYVVDFNDSWVVYLNLKQVVTAADTYTLKVAEGDISEYLNSANKCPVFEVSYTVTPMLNSNSGPESITPASGTTVEELGIVYLKFNAADYPNGLAVNSSAMIPVYDSNGVEVAKAKTTLDYTDNTSLTVKCSVKADNGYADRVITDMGDYTITIPEGCIWDKSDVFKYVPQIDLAYTVGAAPQVTATWSIEEGAEIEKLETVTVTFNDVLSVRSVTMYPEVFYSVSEDGTATPVSNYCTAGVLDASSVGNSLTYTVDYECYSEIANGNYRIVIPAGSIYFNGEETNTNTEEYVLNFVIKSTGGSTAEGALPIGYDPVAGSTVEELSYIMIEFSPEDYPNTIDYDYTAKAEVYNEAGELVTTGGYGSVPPYYTISITLETPITTEGTYTVKVGEGHIREYAWDANNVQNPNPKQCPAFEIVYKVGEAPKPLEITAIADPAEGIVESLSDFTITFEGAEQVAMDEYASKFPYVALVDEEGNIGTTVSNTMVFPFADQPNQLSIGTFADITDAGKYALVIPTESLVFNGNPEIKVAEENFIFYYEIEGAKPQYGIVVSPAAGEVSTDDLKVITITFEGASSIEFNEIGQPGNLYQVDEDGTIIKEYQSSPMLVSDVAYTFTPYYPPTEKGSYRLIIPARAVYVTDMEGVTGPNDEFVVDYRVTEVGIEGVDTEATDLNVYSIDGVCILRNASASDVKNLQKGIYIVNGKKVVIR